MQLLVLALVLVTVWARARHVTRVDEDGVRYVVTLSNTLRRTPSLTVSIKPLETFSELAEQYPGVLLATRTGLLPINHHAQRGLIMPRIKCLHFKTPFSTTHYCVGPEVETEVASAVPANQAALTLPLDPINLMTFTDHHWTTPESGNIVQDQRRSLRELSLWSFISGVVSSVGTLANTAVHFVVHTVPGLNWVVHQAKYGLQDLGIVHPSTEYAQPNTTMQMISTLMTLPLADQVQYCLYDVSPTMMNRYSFPMVEKVGWIVHSGGSAYFPPETVHCPVNESIGNTTCSDNEERFALCSLSLSNTLAYWPDMITVTKKRETSYQSCIGQGMLPLSITGFGNWVTSDVTSYTHCFHVGKWRVMAVVEPDSMICYAGTINDTLLDAPNVYCDTQYCYEPFSTATTPYMANSPTEYDHALLHQVNLTTAQQVVAINAMGYTTDHHQRVDINRQFRSIRIIAEELHVSVGTFNRVIVKPQDVVIDQNMIQGRPLMSLHRKSYVESIRRPKVLSEHEYPASTVILGVSCGAGDTFRCRGLLTALCLGLEMVALVLFGTAIPLATTLDMESHLDQHVKNQIMEMVTNHRIRRQSDKPQLQQQVHTPRLSPGEIQLEVGTQKVYEDRLD